MTTKYILYPYLILGVFALLISSLISCVKPTPTSAPTTTPQPPSQSQGELIVHFIDVGQGDAILIDLAEIEILIDGGDREPGVTNYLKSQVQGPIEVMVATHPHADHIGGLIAVLQSFEINEIWLNGDTATSKTFQEFMSLVDAEGATVYEAERGQLIEAGILTFDILNPPQEFLFDDINNNSIVLSLSYGDIDFLFTGDAEHEAEAAMLVASDMPVPDVDILKIGHHCSRTASSADFLALTTPEIAIYMAAEDNTYGHPHQEAVNTLNNIGAKIYGTETNGTIVVTTDGTNYEINKNVLTIPSATIPPTTEPATETKNSQ